MIESFDEIVILYMVDNLIELDIAEGDKNGIFSQGFDNQTSIRKHLTSNACF